MTITLIKYEKEIILQAEEMIGATCTIILE